MQRGAPIIVGNIRIGTVPKHVFEAFELTAPRALTHCRRRREIVHAQSCPALEERRRYSAMTLSYGVV
eukprot:2092536-Prymnesium_polylepis.1